jgi:hypothetical protein
MPYDRLSEDAKVQAILSGGREEIDRFLVVSVMGLQRCFEEKAIVHKWLASRGYIVLTIGASIGGAVGLSTIIGWVFHI